MIDSTKSVKIIDSHTGGEPTRVVIQGGPNLGTGTVAQRLERFRAEHDRFRSAVVNEPRGSDVLVGALLVEPAEPDCAAGVIFFNNVGYLGMCGHGTIGLIVTLAHMGRIKPGTHRIDTCVGVVTATLNADGSVSVQNVSSYRKATGIAVDVSGRNGEPVKGDLAWAGNWFYLVENHGQELSLKNVDGLTAYAWRVRHAINKIHPEVDHIELFGPPQAGGNSRSFVHCPGGAYDRSPCGTGTSAKLACLAAGGKLAPGSTWTQESILGSTFEGTYQWDASDTKKELRIIPTITGRAYVNAEATFLFDAADPFAWGIRH